MNSRGFSLIELMIVIVVIGILAALIVPRSIDLWNRAREEEVRNNMHTLQFAVEEYAKANDGMYPVTVYDAEDYYLQGTYPDNPFVKGDSEGIGFEDVTHSKASWDQPGQILYERSQENTYVIRGRGVNARVLTLVLTNSDWWFRGGGHAHL